MTAAHSTPKRGEVYRTDAGVTVLVVSSTVYNEVLSEPTVVVVPVFDSEPDAGFGVDIGDGWAAPGLISSLRKTRLTERRRRVDVQALTDVNTMLFRILATPERCSRPPGSRGPFHEGLWDAGHRAEAFREGTLWRVLRAPDWLAR